MPKQELKQKMNHKMPVRASRGLTEREKEVVVLVSLGSRNREVAETLGISVKTVETHRANIMNKLAFRNLAQLIHYAILEGLIDVDQMETAGG